MIVEPDFLTHWKTQLLTAELGDERAPLYVLRLWAFAQQRLTADLNRPSWVLVGFNQTVIKSICHYDGDAEKLVDSLLFSGYLKKLKKDTYHIHDWEIVNAKLVQAKVNGNKGGRPPKPNDNPTGNPKRTQAKPIDETRQIELTNRIEALDVSKLDQNKINHVANRLSERIPWPTAADALFLRQVSIATAAEILTEAQVYEAIEATMRAKDPPRKPIAYFTRCLKDQLSTGVTIDAIRAIKAPAMKAEVAK